MTRYRFLLLFLTVIFAVIPLTAEDRTVSEIIWDSPLPYSDFSKLIKISEGEPYSIRNIRRTVKLLYASKQFEQINVTSQQSKDGKVKIRIKAKPQLVIKEINIRGNRKFSDRELKLASGIGLNSLYFIENIGKIRDEIIYYYKENGYFLIRTSISVEKISPTSVKMDIDITEGPQAKITRFIINGDFTKSDLRKLNFELESNFKNNPYTDKNISDIEFFLIDKFKKEGYLAISVTSDKRPNGVVALSIRKGNMFILKSEGIDSFSPDVIRKTVESVPNYHFDTDGIRKKLEILYHAYGFHDAEIRAEVTENMRGMENTSVINIKVKENERRFINSIIINGASERNRRIVEKRLADFIDGKIDEENFPLILINRTHTGGGYVDADGTRERTLKDSRENKVGRPDSPHGIPRAYLEEIREMTEKIYQNGGYAEVEVSEAKIIEKDGKLFLSMDVVENTHYILSGISAFTGDSKLDSEVKKKIKLPRPMPFNDSIVKAYQKRISDLLTKNNYVFHLITHEERREGNKVYIDFKAEYLFKVKITEVVIAGNYLTTTWVVRHIVRIDPGDMLEGDSFHKSRRNLLQTGVFQSADIAFIDPEIPNTEKDIVVTVSESERFKISPGVGISSDEGVRLFGTFEWKNMVRSGFSSKLSLKFSRKIELFMNDRFKRYYDDDFTSAQRFERNINLTFLFPDTYIPKVPLSAQIEAFHIHDIRSNGGLPYMLDKNGLFFSLFRRFSDRYFLSAGFELSYRNEKDYEFTESGDVDYETLQRLVIAPEIRGYIDFRDSVFFPTKGWKLSLRYMNSSSVLGDRNQYSLLEGSLAFYVPLHYRTNFAGDLVSTDQLIYLAFIQSSFIIPHSGELSSDDVLKLGGNSTVRGFYNNELKPNDQKGENSEGKFSLFMRNELRIKIIQDFYLVGFFDLGNLWEEVSHVGDGELFRYSSGGGLLYASPIGSISAQAGFNLRPREGENTWTIHVFLSTL